MKTTDLVRERVADIRDGKIKGITTGLGVLDKYSGRMEKGQVWIAGGYTGTGKSFLVLNMIDGQLKEAKKLGTTPHIVIFSTELSEDDYIYRHCLMRLGLYKSQFEYEITDPVSEYENRMMIELEEYDELIENGTITIYGGITKLEDIVQLMNVQKVKPDVIYIDYIQELIVENKYDVKDTMPIIAKKLKGFALTWKTSIIAISQINNYAMSKESDPNKTQLAPFTFGRELVNAAHCAILIARDKEQGELKKELNLFILKARGGELRMIRYEIRNGFNLLYINPNDPNKNS